jgi:hypothetical protein
VPPDQRGTITAERLGTHDAANIRTLYWNFGMVGDYPADPINVDLSVFHSLEVPKGSGMNYSDGFTPFVLAKVRQNNGNDAYIMETGFRERQGISPISGRVMRFEPRPGFFQVNPSINLERSPAISDEPSTWPDSWPDKLADPDDPGWAGSWNGYFGKRAAADQESFAVMDDDFYDAWDYNPDASDPTRRGLGLRIQVRGLQWTSPQAGNVTFWLYDITNEGTIDYDDNIIFGHYVDVGVGGSQLSCDGLFESDDDLVYLDRSLTPAGKPVDVAYTWDNFGHGVDLSGPCGPTGYLGYTYLETPGRPFDGIDNDGDGITDERRDNGPGTLIVGQQAIRDFVTAAYDLSKFEQTYGPLDQRPGYINGRWWTGDEDIDWDSFVDDVGADGVADTHDTGELDGVPTDGEPHFGRTDVHESDQIGLTGFKTNRIRSGPGNPDPTTDNILFFTDANNWPARLYSQFTNPDEAARFDTAPTSIYNIAFLLASGPLRLPAGKTERLGLALVYGADLDQFRSSLAIAHQIYDDNYQFDDGSTATLASLIDVDASPERVLLHWRLGESGTARLERSTSLTSWIGVGEVHSDGTNDVRFEDHRIEAGAHYTYRLSVRSDGEWASADEVRVEVPIGPALSVALRPNPAKGSALTVQLSLAHREPARLELLDLAGRRVLAREVGSLGPGEHVVDLAEGMRIRPGVYMLRLVQGQSVRSTRVAVLE